MAGIDWLTHRVCVQNAEEMSSDAWPMQAGVCEWLEREGWRGDGKFCKLRISFGAWREGRVEFEVVEIVGLMVDEHGNTNQDEDKA